MYQVKYRHLGVQSCAYCILFHLLLTFNLQLSLFILTLKTPFHVMQTKIYFQRNIKPAFFQIVSLFSYNFSMTNLLWAANYTCSYSLILRHPLF